MSSVRLGLTNKHSSHLTCGSYNILAADSTADTSTSPTPQPRHPYTPLPSIRNDCRLYQGLLPYDHHSITQHCSDVGRPSSATAARLPDQRYIQGLHHQHYKHNERSQTKGTLTGGQPRQNFCANYQRWGADYQLWTEQRSAPARNTHETRTLWLSS